MEFIFSSTAAVYGEPEMIPITEAAKTTPVNPYGQTKLTVEQVLNSCSTAFGLRYTSLRYFNASGADESGKIGESHEPETHLIPLVLKTAKRERDSITVFGTDYPTPDGTCIRDYIHVSDLAHAHLLALNALEQGAPGNIYNLGNNQGYSVREVIETAKKVTQLDINVVEGSRRLGDPAVLIASSEKIRSELGWNPRYPDLETIIRSAWKWENR
jgi:UDP-glucose 4-epimerase